MEKLNTHYMKIKRIEANWHFTDKGEQFLTYDTTQNCTDIEEKDGFMFVTMEDEVHRLPVSTINITIYEKP